MLQETKTKETKVKCKATISEKAGKINIEEPTPRQNLLYFCLFCLLNLRIEDYQDLGRKTMWLSNSICQKKHE